jgi:formylglycine-generating enzyme required for sulfatase activity
MVDCPSDEQLSALVTGTLGPEEIERLCRHVEGCAGCEVRVSAMDNLSDPLMNGLRSRGGKIQREAEHWQGQVLGDYVLGEELGSGGMGRVFRATHSRMRREVALKVVSRRGMRSTDAVRRFAREVEVAAKLIHPNIAIAYDAREQDGVVYLIMEYVAGQDLARMVKEKGPLAIDEAVDYVIQAARGLAYAHGRGIVHRDVKPANLIRDGEGVVKVLDLGLSRLREGADFPSSVGLSSASGNALSGEMTQAGDVLGTADFVAPEQAQSPQDADHLADVYSLGCTLFYLLTGRSPFGRGSTKATLAAHRDDPAPSLRKARPGVSARLEAVFQRMIAKRPGDRLATMNDVIRGLRGCQHGSGRRRVIGLVAACALLALAIGGVWWRVHSQSHLTGTPATQARIQPPLPIAPFSPMEAVRHRDQWCEYANAPAVMTNAIGMKFAFIPPGEYAGWGGVTMRITRPYFIGVHELTIGQFRAFVRETKYKTVAEKEGGLIDGHNGFEARPGLTWENPGFEHTDDFPALQLAYTDVQAFARWLSNKETRSYRMPTVAQWTWAAQAGTAAPDIWYEGEDAGEYGWTSANSGRIPHAVGTRKANPWGLYDVRGNAVEWCADIRDESATKPQTGLIEDPTGAFTGNLRMLLGSSFQNDNNYVVPGNAGPNMRYITWGARLMCEIEGAPRYVAPGPATTNKSR